MSQLKCDLHIHTVASPDSHSTVAEVLEMAKSRGFDAVAITDHDTTASAREAIALENPGITIIPGIEVSTKKGHVLILGTTKEYAPGKSAKETIQEAKKDGCTVIIPHPYHRFRHSVGLGEEDALILADGIEGYNSRYYTSWSNEKAVKVANNLKKPITAGSDAHEPIYVGYGINLIDAEDNTVDSILKAIREGKITATCKKTPSKVYARESVKNAKRNVKNFTKRLFGH